MSRDRPSGLAVGPHIFKCLPACTKELLSLGGRTLKEGVPDQDAEIFEPRVSVWEYGALRTGPGAIGFDGKASGRPKPSLVKSPRQIWPPLKHFPWNRLLVVHSMDDVTTKWCIDRGQTTSI